MHKVVYVTIAAAAIFFVTAVSIRFIPSVTALPAAQGSATIDPYALQMTIEVKNLPEQETGDLI